MKTVYIEKGLGISRKTATTYLSALEEAGFLSSEKVGKERIYLNRRLFETVKKAGTRS
jgi:predicted transcriptional regulator